MSGRHQISSDGKHLVDGIAFGRPLLRRPIDRPVVNIPPRKRQRITYTEAEDDDESLLALVDRVPLEEGALEHNEDGNRQLVLHADFEDDDSEDDEDFAPDEDDEEEEDVESYGEQQAENEAEDDENDAIGQGDSEDMISLDDEHTSPRAMFRKLHSAFPTSPIAVCKRVLSRSNGDLDVAYEAMSRGFNPAIPKSAIAEALQESLSVPKSRSAKPKIAAEEPRDRNTIDLELDGSMNPLLEHYDQNGLPQGSIKSGKALSHMAEVVKSSTARPRGRSNGRVTSGKSVKFAEQNLPNGLTSTPIIDLDSQIYDSKDTDNDETSSSGDSSSSESELYNAEDSESSSSGTSSDGSNSDSSNESSSDDDSGPEETSSKTGPTISAGARENRKDSRQDAVLNPEPTKSVPPGEGKKQTKTRNARRRNAIALKKLKEKGIVPADTTATEFSKSGIDNKTEKEEALAALEAIRSVHLAKVDDGFLARRQQLLDSLESGGVEIGQQFLETARRSSVASDIPNTTEIPQSSTLEDVPLDVPAQSIPPTPIESGDSATPPSRRARLDISAGRRLLFGALGIKNPKTKKDEEKLRNDLLKDARPMFTPKPVEEPASTACDGDMDEDPDAWKQSIIYRAVECCHDGVKLSEPPFPFVQRWDPQQKGVRSKQVPRGGKRKKDLRDEPQYYDSSHRASKKQKLRKGKHSYAEEQEYLDGSYEPSYQDDSTGIDYDDATQDFELPGDEVKKGVSSPLISSMKYDGSAGSSQDPADLAPLPEDPSTLPDLEVGQVVPGMTIAFKQLIMSEATKWQPQISSYRTAIVIAKPESGVLHLTLALRDRELANKYYDEETGDRIYGRFDMPIEEEEEPQDDGVLNLGFSELIEPKIVQSAPDNLVADTTIDDATKEVLEPNSGHSNMKESTKEQFSHVTETPLDSEVSEPALPAEDMNPPEQEYSSPGEAPDLPGQASDGADNAVAGNTVEDVHSMPVVTETISDEARQEISYMMREAGFRSSVPSTILKDIRPSDVKSPGDDAVFEKLMRDMTDIGSNLPSSPKFQGFGSSSPTKQSELHLSSVVNVPEPSSSSPAPLQSSWHTVPLDESSSPPAMSLEREIDQADLEDGPGESWETIDPPSPVQKPTKRNSNRKLHLAHPIQKAKLLWEQLSRPSSCKLSVSLPGESPTHVPENGTLGLDDVNGSDSNATVRYPKLPVGSSFTSQISDHGHQPDADFDDSTALDVNSLKAPMEESSNQQDGATGVDFSLPALKSAAEDTVSDAEPELPRNPTKKLPASKGKGREIEEDLSSSDDSLPSLEVVFSQREPKPEQPRSVSSRAPTKEDKEHHMSRVSISQRSSEEFESLAPPRSASQPNPKPRSSLAHTPNGSSSQSHRKKFTLPQGSQVMDLTLSSDVEEKESREPLFGDEEGLEVAMPVFRRYKMADDDDDEYRDGDDKAGGKKKGWVKKKSSQSEAPRRTGTRARSLSQTSPNPRGSRRKTIARF
jgi:hypothetical protein